jgi:large subunit ribosomal protein L22
VIATAKLRYLGVSAQKTRLLADTVRGRNVGDALSLLRFSRKLVARDLEKLMKSAVTNAQQKDPKLDVDRLVVRRFTVDEGPPGKRVRQRSMGRIYRILKRSCHVTVGLDVVAPPPRPAPRTKAAGAAKAEPAAKTKTKTKTAPKTAAKRPGRR